MVQMAGMESQDGRGYRESRVPLVLMAVMVKLEGLVLEGHLEIMVHRAHLAPEAGQE